MQDFVPPLRGSIFFLGCVPRGALRFPWAIFVPPYGRAAEGSTKRGRGGGAATLFAEDLQHGFILRLIDLGEGLGDEGASFKTAGVEHFVEAESSVAKEHLSILETLVVVGDRYMDFMGEFLNVLEEG